MERARLSLIDRANREPRETRDIANIKFTFSIFRYLSLFLFIRCSLRPGSAFLIQSTRKARVTRHLLRRAFNARARTRYYAPVFVLRSNRSVFSLA